MASTGVTGIRAHEKERFIDVYQREAATTLRVLRAYPQDQIALRPHPRAKSAQELAWMFVAEQMLGTAAVQDRMDLSRGVPPAPDTLDQIIAAFEKATQELVAAVRSSDLAGTTTFFTAPGTMGDVPKMQFLWFLLHDQIHHRGQFSIYLRMAGGKVPSIYGPSADEPWT